MKPNYTKHQRDYTVLFTSLVFKECFTANFLKKFPINTHPMYIWVRDGNLCHFIPEENYSAWPNAWYRINNLSSLIKYEKTINKVLINHKRLLISPHKNISKSLIQLHQLARNFLPIVIISAYLPMYCSNAPKKLIDQCLKYRKKYENAHKSGITLEIKLLRKLESQFGIAKDTLQFLTIEEFDKFLHDKQLPKNITKRKIFAFIEYSKRGVAFYSELEATNKLKNINPTISKNIREIEGSIAYRGIARGKVKVIKAIKDVGKLKEGEILVTTMTDPRYLLAMKRAMAIVTDEGGITCHAAIVARELRKPCIMIATQVLKDGDRVEVDANKGVVRKIN